MGLWLKQSTAVDVIVGPFLDETDGKTAETGLTVTQAEVRLSKNGGNMAQKNEATSLVHDELGYYDCNLDATDTNTLGRLQLMVHESGALPVYHEYMVVTANEYDSMCSTDYKEVDLIQMGGVAQSGTDLKDFADAGYDPATNKVQGVVLTDTTTAVTNTVNLSAASETQIDNIETDTNEIQGKLPTNKIMGSSDATDKDDEIDAIKAKTDNLPADPADDSDIDAAIAAVPAAVWAVAMEGALTAKEQMNINHAVLAGKSSGGGTATIKFRDAGDAKDRQNATVDADGNRTAVVTDGA